MWILRGVLLMGLLQTGCSRYQVSPLAAAARRGETAAIRTLMRAGADPNAPSGVNGWTPLMHAIHKNQASAVAELLAGGADPNRANSAAGTTALMMAAGYGQDEIIQLLLERGADAARKNAKGLAALDLAVSGVTDIDAWTRGQCRPSTVRLLLEKAPKVARSDEFQRRAAGYGKQCPGVAELLAAPARASR